MIKTGVCLNIYAVSFFILPPSFGGNPGGVLNIKKIMYIRRETL